MFTEFNSINREAFMLILATIFEMRAAKDRLTNAVRRVGITNDTLSVEFMQQDMLKRAEDFMKPETSSPINEGEKRKHRQAKTKYQRKERRSKTKISPV